MSRGADMVSRESVRTGRYRPRQGSGTALRRIVAGLTAWSDRLGGGTSADRPGVEVPVGASGLVRELLAHPRLLAASGVLGAFVLALAIRGLFLGTAYDLFVDEVTYFFISQSVANGHGVLLHAQPFFLHPPLFFLTEGPYILLTQPSGLLLQQVLDVRVLDALLGAATSVVLLLLATRVGGWRVGLVTYLLFSLDPFIVRINSRNLLETPALLLVMLGYLALVWGPIEPGRVGVRRLVVVGVCFGGALLTKEMTFFLTLLPVALLFIAGWVLPRRTALGILVVAAVVYSAYPIGVFLTGLGPVFVAEKLSGLLRFLGIMKTTGFVHGGPSFGAAVIRNLDVFATTYVLIALGIPGSILLAWRGDARRRVLGVLGVSAYALLAYSIALGTLEEQFFYFLVLPTIVTVPLAWTYAVALERRARGLLAGAVGGGRAAFGEVAHRLMAAGRVALPVALVVSLAWSTVVWLEVHHSSDDGYRQVMAYLHGHVPQGTALGVTTEPQEFVFQGYVIKPVTSSAQLASSAVRYAVISTKQIEDGYTPNGNAIWSWLRAHADPVYIFDGRTYGQIQVYRLPNPAG